MNHRSHARSGGRGCRCTECDYPRLGAKPWASGRSQTGRTCTHRSAGPVRRALAAIRELSHLLAPTQEVFVRLLRDPDDRFRAPQQWPWSSPARRPPYRSTSTPAPHRRKQRAGMQRGPHDRRTATGLLLSLSMTKTLMFSKRLCAPQPLPGEVPAGPLLPFLNSGAPPVRAAAALALARHQPKIAALP